MNERKHTHRELYRHADLAALPFTDTRELASVAGLLGQDRVEEALALSLAMPGDGYNVFVMGQEGAGKHVLVGSLVREHAKGQPVPEDLCYVICFEDSRRPRALRLPPGMGRALRADVEHLVVSLRIAIRAAFDSDDYRNRKQVLAHELEQRGAALLEEVSKEATERKLAFMRTPVGFAFAPMRGDEVMSPDAFSELPESEQKQIKEQISELEKKLASQLAQLPRLQREAHEQIEALDHEVTEQAARTLFEEVIARYAEVAPAREWLELMRTDVVEHASAFLDAQEDPGEPSAAALSLGESDPPRWPLRRYAVNLLVDRADDRGAPVIYEDHPTLEHLAGRVEYRAQLGNLVTDFTMIQPGALHRSNGGYLLLDAAKLLQQPQAYEALKRALRSRQVRVESLAESLGFTSGARLVPEAVPLCVKVALLGDRRLYYLLCAYDPDFSRLFKVVADFADDIPRDVSSEQAFARLIAGILERVQLRPFQRDAVARVIEHAARLAGDAGRLSMNSQALVDLLREADYFAGKAGQDAVRGEHVEQAIFAQARRLGRIRDESLRLLGAGTLLLSTRGEVVGQVNALTVLALGGFAFGRPSRVTCRVRAGRGELIDIEREARLGGPLHSKGVMILAGFLGGRYARDWPLSLSASVVFEQSYGGVDGDSASLAELCALLSAIGDVPIRQRFALTGSVSQLGEVQPIGAVNEKIEGFYDACAELGLVGDEAVIIPRSNVRHAMLRKDVAQAIEAGKFSVYSVEHVDEALSLLTGLDASVLEDGSFPEAGFHARVARRLAALSERVRGLDGIERRVEVAQGSSVPEPGIPGPGPKRGFP